jgi:hypothetical protein
VSRDAKSAKNTVQRSCSIFWRNEMARSDKAARPEIVLALMASVSPRRSPRYAETDLAYRKLPAAMHPRRRQIPHLDCLRSKHENLP